MSRARDGEACVVNLLKGYSMFEQFDTPLVKHSASTNLQHSAENRCDTSPIQYLHHAYMTAMTREELACITGDSVVRIKHHRHDRLRRPVRTARRFHRAVLAQQPGRDAHAQSRSQQEADRDADHRRRQQAAALRHRARLVVAARDRVAGGCGAGRRLRQDLRPDGERPPRRAHRASRRTSRCCRRRSPVPASARRCRR